MRESLHNQGFSLPELMVATTILAVVMTGAMLVFTAQHRTYVSQGQMLAVQQDARLVTQMMIADVRAGGFLVPKTVGLAAAAIPPGCWLRCGYRRYGPWQRQG